MQDIKMLLYIRKNAETRKMRLESALRDTNDPSLRKVIRAQLRRYQAIHNTATNYLLARGAILQGNGPIKRLSLSLSDAIKNSVGGPAGIAKKMIKANTAGYKKSARQFQAYHGQDPYVISLANELLQVEKRCMNQLKAYYKDPPNI